MLFCGSVWWVLHSSTNPRQRRDTTMIYTAHVVCLFRRCPGMQFANQSLFFTFASILACFGIAPLVDIATGKPFLPMLEFAGGAFRHPKSFKYRDPLRHAETEALVEAAAMLSIHP
ncbi:hypothetical protein C8Q73DRAFT_168046 [Cubamyces lactineus]|nr:hypothetical protein C8Q73DRAFT_168046 [Cubamyces lactineus]